jgi:hypothetical protein
MSRSKKQKTLTLSSTPNVAVGFGEKSPKSNSKNKKLSTNSESLPRIRNIEVGISKDNLDSQIAALLYAWGFAKDNEEILDISLGAEAEGIVPLKYTLKKRREVRITDQNGTTR